MNQEKLTQNTVSYSVNITNNAVDSFRISSDLKTVIRVYDGGCIGIAGAIGECDEEALAEQAKEKLTQGIPYPDSLPQGGERTEVVENEFFEEGEMVPACRALVGELAETYPGFIFANKINTIKYTAHYVNSAGCDYCYSGNTFVISLTIKAKGSANIMDLGYGTTQNYFDAKKIVSDVGVLLNVYENKLPMPEEELPVLIPTEVLQYIATDMIAEKYMAGSSLLGGKLGEQVFNKKVNFNVYRKTDNTTLEPFFDDEGTTLEGDQYSIIKDGVLNALITYRRSAANFSLPLSGSASSDFDGVPTFGNSSLRLMPSDESLKELLGGGRAIYVAMTSGGDMTRSGDLGLPVQLAYLYEDGRLVGVLPEFSLTGNIFEVLGDSLIGIAKNDAFQFMDETLIATKMKVNK